MICEKCGSYMPDGSLTCDVCGTPLSKKQTRYDTGVRAIRQGRVNAVPPTLPDTKRDSVPEYGDYDLSALPVQQEAARRRKLPSGGIDAFASRPNTRRGLPVNAHGHTATVKTRQRGHASAKRMQINWTLILLILFGLALLGGGAYLYYMSATDDGQRITARQNTLAVDEALFALARNTQREAETEREALLRQWGKTNAQSYWFVGAEYIDAGDVETGIKAYRIADVLDRNNYDGMLSLANAYELAADDESAEAVYMDMILNVAPSRTEAYTALIRLLQAQDRDPESADMMKLAYENTGKESYRLQREDFIPNMPLTDLAAGRYEMDQVIHLSSPQGYDIYYASDDDVSLPEGGMLYDDKSGLTLREGTINLRAVCVSDDLVSDPLSVSYTIYFPTPAAPECNLAPNTYKTRRKVSLRAGEGNEKDELVFHYTIDGSMPDKNSPIYDGTPIQLPTGRVYLRAVCVNIYGKMSSTLEVFYKIDCKPYPLKMYGEEDTFSGFLINTTTMAAFRERFGEPTGEVATQYLSLDNEALHLTYPWGYAVFTLNGNVWVLVRVEMTSAFTTGPRGVGLGSSESEVVGVYKDMGQPPSLNGDRGLYYTDPDIGYIYQNADGTRTVQYNCNTVSNKVWVLQYHIRNNRVERISHYYQP